MHSDHHRIQMSRCRHRCSVMFWHALAKTPFGSRIARLAKKSPALQHDTGAQPTLDDSLFSGSSWVQALHCKVSGSGYGHHQLVISAYDVVKRKNVYLKSSLTSDCAVVEVYMEEPTVQRSKSATRCLHMLAQDCHSIPLCMRILRYEC